MGEAKKKDSNIRFIRRKGRIIPIRTKSGKKFDEDKKLHKGLKKKGASASKNISRGEFSARFKRQSDRDSKLAKQGTKVAKTSFGVAVGAGVLGVLSRKIKKLKGISKGSVILSGASLVFAGLNQGFAEGRKTSSDLAKKISKGKSTRKLKGLGGASASTLKEARFLEKFIK